MMRGREVFESAAGNLISAGVLGIVGWCWVLAQGLGVSTSLKWVKITAAETIAIPLWLLCIIALLIGVLSIQLLRARRTHAGVGPAPQIFSSLALERELSADAERVLALFAELGKITLEDFVIARRLSLADIEREGAMSDLTDAGLIHPRSSRWTSQGVRVVRLTEDGRRRVAAMRESARPSA